MAYPWHARDQLGARHDAAATQAAIHALCGDYSQALQLLDSSQPTPLYLALLLATGRADEARALGSSEALDAAARPEDLARELLLAKLREF